MEKIAFVSIVEPLGVLVCSFFVSTTVAPLAVFACCFFGKKNLLQQSAFIGVWSPIGLSFSGINGSNSCIEKVPSVTDADTEESATVAL